MSFKRVNFFHFLMFYADFKGIPGNRPILSLAANGKVRQFQEARSTTIHDTAI